MSGGIFDGLFTNGETREQRRARHDRLMASATAVARGMRREAAEQLLNSTELALFGHLADGMETREDK